MEDEGQTSSCLSIEFRRDFATDFKALGVNVSIDFALAEMELKSGLVSAGNSAEAEQDRLLEMFNRYKTECEQSRKLILEKEYKMKAMSTSLVDIERKVATIYPVTGLLAKSNAESLLSARLKEAKSTCTGDNFC